LFLLGNGRFCGYAESTPVPPIDPNTLPKDVEVLHKIVVDLCEQLRHESSEKDKYRSLLRELLDAQRNRKSEQLSKEQLAMFEVLWKASDREEEESEPASEQEQDKPEEPQTKKRSGRRPLAKHLIRERIVHDLAEAEKHCDGCGQDLRLMAEETSERYEYIPASIKVIEDVRMKYACDCTVKTADKPAQPIEKSTAGASMLAQVIVSKFADHQPLHRQEKIFQRQGVQISRKTMGGWLPSVAELFDPLYQAAKKVLFESKVIGTDDTGVKVLDRKLPFARTGRIWPYVGDAHHPVVVYDYTPTRGRDGPARFLEGYLRIFASRRLLRLRCIFQTRAGADRGGVHDAFAPVLFQGAGLGPATDGEGAASDRAPVFNRGSRQGSHRRRESRTTPAAIRAGDGETAQISGRDPRRSSAQEPGRNSRALCAESMERAVALS